MLKKGLWAIGDLVYLWILLLWIKIYILVHSWMKRQYSLNTFIEYIWECLYLLNIFWNRLINIYIGKNILLFTTYIQKEWSLKHVFGKKIHYQVNSGKLAFGELVCFCSFCVSQDLPPPPSTRSHAGAQTLTPRTVGRARTCLEMMSFPSGIGAPFSVAILFKVAMAFSWFPDSTSYLALSGSHCGDRCGRLGWNRTLGPSHILSPGCGVFKGGAFGARGLASNAGSVIDYIGCVTLSNYLTSLCLHFLIHKMGIMIDPIS